MRRHLLALMLTAVPALAGCEWLGIESAEVIAQRKEAESRAIGSACRHAMRAIEDCYALNPKARKAAVFAGWREMDEYMRENKLEGIAPTIPSAASAPEAVAQADAGADPRSSSSKH